MTKSLKIAIIAGEESGDMLGADLIKAARCQHGAPIELIGVGGRHLSQLGLKSLFPMEEIALMGLGQILKKLPQLYRHIHQTAAQIIAAKPDGLLVVDAPDFTHRVAMRVRAKLPNLPIIQYVAPSVWAWRAGRAQQMRRFIDHLLVVLPFEVEALRQLDGPEATYVGHPLLFDKALSAARNAQKNRLKSEKEPPHLVVLPGSRRSEITHLMPLFGETIALLQKRLPTLHVTLPTLPSLHGTITELAQSWTIMPKIVTSKQDKIQSFAVADSALAASGTVSLELALAHVPMVLCYQADWFAKHFILPKITIWSAALPNLIADVPIVPEYYNEFVRPALLARQLQRHMVTGAPRQAQELGFDAMLEAMQTPLSDSSSDPALSAGALSSGERAARVLLDLTCRKRH